MTWRGAQLYKSTDGTTYAAQISSGVSATIGTASSALGDFDGGNVFDHENTVTVYLRAGSELTSYTELQVLNGAGIFVLGAQGRYEIVQYMTATLIGTNTYELSGLLRGRRGTEWAMGLHQIGDAFVLADARAWQRLNPGTAEIGLSRYFKAVTSRDSLTATSSQTFSNTAVGLECYAPVHLTGERDGSNNLTINWVRRTRIGGEWRDYVDVQLGESEMRFDVEVWDATYETLLRTIDCTTVTVDYSAAQQTSDGLTPGDPVYLKIYQISSTVGRGYALTGSV